VDQSDSLAIGPSKTPAAPAQEEMQFQFQLLSDWQRLIQVIGKQIDDLTTSQNRIKSQHNWPQAATRFGSQTTTRSPETSRLDQHPPQQPNIVSIQSRSVTVMSGNRLTLPHNMIRCQVQPHTVHVSSQMPDFRRSDILERITHETSRKTAVFAGQDRIFNG
jgi:hypothetical protein